MDRTKPMTRIPRKTKKMVKKSIARVLYGDRNFKFIFRKKKKYVKSIEWEPIIESE